MAVYTGLKERVLSDMDTCRRVWEEEGDPMALCEAVRRADLPIWLADSLLVLLTNGQGGYPDTELLERAWDQRNKNDLDRSLALSIAMFRTHPKANLTWEQSRLHGESFARERSQTRAVGDSSAKKTFYKVKKSLTTHRSRYFYAPDGLGDRIQAAWQYVLDVMRRNWVEK